MSIENNSAREKHSLYRESYLVVYCCHIEKFVLKVNFGKKFCKVTYGKLNVMLNFFWPVYLQHRGLIEPPCEKAGLRGFRPGPI